MSTATNEQKCEALPSTPQVGVTLYSCVHSLRGSLLDLPPTMAFARCVNKRE
jgi:hypothetical protein